MLNSINDIESLEEDKILGEGAFSQVIKVRHKQDNQTYALKVVNLSEISEADQHNLENET